MSNFDLLGRPMSQLTTLTDISSNDFIAVLDISDTVTSGSTAGTLKKSTFITVESFLNNQFLHSNIVSAKVSTTGNLTAVYVNGSLDDGVGATLTNSGAFVALVLDGVTLAINDRVLVYQQSAQLQNGVYQVTDIGSVSMPWVLTRVVDYNNSPPGQIAQGDFIIVTLGTINQRTLWVQVSATPLVVGVDPIVFQELNIAAIPTELWITVISTSQAMVANTGYITDTAILCTLTLPLTSQVGSLFKVQGKGIGGWRVAQNAGQQIIFDTISTTPGITGYIESTTQYGNLSLLCTVANTEFIVNVGPVGNPNLN